MGWDIGGHKRRKLLQNYGRVCGNCSENPAQVQEKSMNSLAQKKEMSGEGKKNAFLFFYPVNGSIHR